MRALSERRQKFVVAFIGGGGVDATAAAMSAGYGRDSDGALRVQAFRLMHSPEILKALREEADRRLDASVYVAAAALVEIAADPEHRDRYKAAADIMDRRGFLRVTGHQVEIEDRRTEAELVEFIAVTAKRHGLDPKLLLGSDVKIMDAKAKAVEFPRETMEED